MIGLSRKWIKRNKWYCIFVSLACNVQVAAADNASMLVSGSIGGQAHQDNAVAQYALSGAFDRFLVRGGTPGGRVWVDDIDLGPDGNLYVSAFGSIARHSLIDGRQIDLFINTAGVGRFCFGPDKKIYALQSVSDPLSGDHVLSLRRFFGSDSATPGQIDNSFQLPLRPNTYFYRCVFGPDFNGDGIGDFFLLSDNTLRAFDGAQILAGNVPQPFSTTYTPQQDSAWRDLAFGPDKSVYLLNHYTASIDRHVYDNGQQTFVSTGSVVAGIGQVATLRFGPDRNNDGYADLYVGLETYNPYSPVDPVRVFDGLNGQPLGSALHSDGLNIHSVGKIIFAPPRDPKLFGVYGLQFDDDGDTYVRTDLDIRRNDNYGLQQFMSVGTGRGGDNKPYGAPDAMRALLLGFSANELPNSEYSLATLPKNQPFSSVFLEMTVEGIPAGSSQTYTLDLYPTTDLGSGAWYSPLEGNGIEGGPAGSVDPDAAEGFAWAGADQSSAADAANNFTQPHFAASPIARAKVVQNLVGPGTVVRWDITRFVQDYLAGKAPWAGGFTLRDTSSSNGVFRYINFHSRESSLASSRPRLLIGYGKGNLNGDGVIDQRDVDVVMAAINTPAYGPLDPRDLDGDGRITILDARKLILLCAKPNCAK